MEFLAHFQAMLGITMILALCWLFSEQRSDIPSWKWIGGALALQAVMAVLIIRVPIIWDIIGLANVAVSAVEAATAKGSAYMFGYLGGAELPFALKPGAEAPLVIAFQILPLVIVFSALSALLWHWRILPLAVRGLSWALRRTMKVTGVEGLAGGAALFLGVVEAPLVLKGYLAKASRAQIFAIMTLTMATISGALLILYAKTLEPVIPNAVGHMISASLLSLPAALLVARMLVPASEALPDPAATETDLGYHGSLDAIVRGTMDGVQLFLAVIGIIIVIFALVALGDQILTIFPLIDGEPLTIKRIFGWLFAPVMWAIGVSWSDAQIAGQLMGTKAILNEYVAFLEFSQLADDSLAPRSRLITAYALCGVANLASIGLLVSTLGSMAPQRRAEFAGLGGKSWLAGNMATLLTGAMVGLVIV